MLETQSHRNTTNVNEQVIRDRNSLGNVSRLTVGDGNGQHELPRPTLMIPNYQDNNDVTTNMRQVNNTQTTELRDPGLLIGDRAQIIHDRGNNNHEQTENTQAQGIGHNENIRNDRGDYRRYFARKIETDAKIQYDRLKRVVENMLSCEEEMIQALQNNNRIIDRVRSRI